MRKAKVAITTPNRPVQVKLFRTIGSDNYEVYYPKIGPGLIEEVTSLKPDVFFMQGELGEGDAYEICRKLKTSPGLGDLTLIILTSDAGNQGKATGALADGILKIPFRDEDVQRFLAEADARNVVLMVDDSKLVHQKLGPILREEGGYEVMEALNGVEAMEVLKKEPIDVVLSDIEMPEMDGFTLCAQIKQDETFRRIPVIMCSSLQSAADIEKGFASGADDYLVKPIIPSELLSRLRKMFDRTSRGKREKILVVDDSRLIRNMIQLALEEQGFSVQTVEHGKAALEAMKQVTPDLVITDYEMPEMDGYGLAMEVRNNPAWLEVPIIMLTAREGRAEQVRAASAGVNGFVVKPFTNEKVLVFVEKLLADQRLTRERKAMKLYLSEGAQEAVQKIADTGASADKVLQSHSTFRSVLFSDIVSFTTKSEGMTATQVVDMLNAYFDTMAMVLRKHDAIVDKYIGDAIMALFGKRDNGPLRAVRCAKEMIDALGPYNQRTGHNIQVRIGINSGEVVAGDIGSKQYRVDHTVIGDNVNTAQRLETAAKPNEVVISQSTYEFVKDFVEVEEVGPFKLKGKANPVPGYKVIKLL